MNQDESKSPKKSVDLFIESCGIFFSFQTDLCNWFKNQSPIKAFKSPNHSSELSL